jgi:DNA (cytosine-5)-methyltransferase 1
MGNFYEFFAGGGMARAGLGNKWRCLFANDFDHKKGVTYRANWGSNDLLTADIRKITSDQLPGLADLAWASFPCQDLSLAGGGAGLRGERSGTFWPFWDAMRSLIRESRAPKIIALENVCGTITSHKGKDFEAICGTFAQAGYQFGAFVVDAALFVPQSRPRLFIIGVRHDIQVPAELQSDLPQLPWHTRGLQNAVKALPEIIKKTWLWWRLPIRTLRNLNIADIIEDEPQGVAWFTDDETQQLIAKMSKINVAKLEVAKKAQGRIVGCIYKRTRLDEKGTKVQRAEARFDDVAGCLRTPAGGSSRQLILIVEEGKVKSRLISARETARLMGLPDSYRLPENYNEAYHLTGDGVVVPVVRHIAQHIFEPLLAASRIAAKTESA